MNTFLCKLLLEREREEWSPTMISSLLLLISWRWMVKWNSIEYDRVNKLLCVEIFLRFYSTTESTVSTVKRAELNVDCFFKYNREKKKERKWKNMQIIHNKSQVTNLQALNTGKVETFLAFKSKESYENKRELKFQFTNDKWTTL